jgi:serine-type D-Ala-D-Ala carboxypeptidase
LASLEELCASYQASGLYTHVYAACGFLDQPQNTAECSLGPQTNVAANQDVYDLSSLTKALVTTPLVLWKCLQSGARPREALISQVFGDIAVDDVGARKFDLLVAEYLRHETGLAAWRNFYTTCDSSTQNLKDVLRRNEPRKATSGQVKDVYSDLGFLVLGQLLEKSAGASLLTIWRDYGRHFGLSACEELGAGFEFARERVVPTAFCPVRNRTLCGEVHDENSWALGGFTGHSGLFGAGKDVALFLRQMWQCPAGRFVLMENFKESSSAGDSLMGWRKGQDPSSQPFADGRGCGHLGFTGTAFWVDPLTKSYAVVLTNRVVSGRITPEIKTFRAEAFKRLWGILQNVG